MSRAHVEVVRLTVEAINERRFDDAAGNWDPRRAAAGWPE